MPESKTTSVLFVCTHNAIRSPMAEAILKKMAGQRIFVQSAGIRPSDIDPFTVAVMAEMGVDLSAHRSKGLDELDDGTFDLVVTLSPEAHHRALEMTRTSSCEVIYWPTFDPTVIRGPRDQRVDAYRSTRDALTARIKAMKGID
jgi:protein-tyrosine-phosphatase